MGMLRALKAGLWLIRTVPAPLLRPLPYILGFLFYLLYDTRRAIIIANQRQVLGDPSALRLHWQAVRVMTNLFHSYHVLARLATMTDEEIRAGVELSGEEHLHAALARGRGVIILGAHIDGYNILAPYTALYHTPAGAFVEPVQPPELFAFVSELRARTGLQLFLADREGALAAMRLLKRNGILMIAGDRYLGLNGTLVRFFGRPTYLSHGPIVLSQRSGAPLLPAILRRLPDGRLLAELQPPIALADTGRRREDLAANMRLLAGALEATIGPVAEQWCVVAPVWSTDPAGQDASRAAVEAAERPRRARPIAAGLVATIAVLYAIRRWHWRRTTPNQE
jgi:phosphatidylinositol dimannoside acyltransferase